MVEDIVVAPSVLDFDKPWIKKPISLKWRLRSLWHSILWFTDWLVLNSPIPTHDSEEMEKSIEGHKGWYYVRDKRNPTYNCHFQSALSELETAIIGYVYTIPEKKQ
jgi:hypothetical protein